jgi:hypothetical protein
VTNRWTAGTAGAAGITGTGATAGAGAGSRSFITSMTAMKLSAADASTTRTCGRIRQRSIPAGTSPGSVSGTISP